MTNDEVVDAVTTTIVSPGIAHQRLLEAASQTAHLWNYYAQLDPYDTSTERTDAIDSTNKNPWRDNPEGIMDQMKNSRIILIGAWKEYSSSAATMEMQLQQQQHHHHHHHQKLQRPSLEDANEPAAPNNDSNDSNSTNDYTKRIFLEMMTDTFSDTLEQMRFQQKQTQASGTVRGTTHKRKAAKHVADIGMDTTMVTANYDNDNDDDEQARVEVVEEELAMDILVDCLQSTMDLFTPDEQAELLK